MLGSRMTDGHASSNDATQADEKSSLQGAVIA